MPDHDFPLGERHKLIPSVYASCLMKESEISFSGPTYIAIRSAKHDSSTAASHQYDLCDVFDMPEFASSVKGKDGQMKPLLFVGVDGGPDEAPSSTKA